jgi:hypothetical protein
LRRLLHGDDSSKEVIIYSAGSFELFYAVLLDLVTIATFQREAQNSSDQRQGEGTSADRYFAFAGEMPLCRGAPACDRHEYYGLRPVLAHPITRIFTNH